MGALICQPSSPFDCDRQSLLSCELVQDQFKKNAPHGVLILPPELLCGNPCSPHDARLATIGLPDSSKNIFADTAAWEEGFGDVMVVKHHVDDEDYSDRDIYLEEKDEQTAMSITVEANMRGPVGSVCHLSFNDGASVGDILLTKHFKHHNFRINEELSKCRQLVLQFDGPAGRADIDCNHGLLVGGVDVLAYVNSSGQDQTDARQGIFHIPNQYLCESTIEIECQSFTGKEYWHSFINGTRTALEGRGVTIDPLKPFTFKYSITPLCFPIISLEVLLRIPPDVEGGMRVNKVLVNGNDCLLTTSYYPLDGSDGASLADETTWTKSGWYRMLCYRRLNKRHSQSQL